MSLVHVVVAENTKIAMEDHKKNSVQTTFDAYFKHFPDKVNEDTPFKWLPLTEVINVVLTCLDGRDRL